MRTFKFEKLGRIVAPRADIPWMSTYAGASFALAVDGTDLFDVYITGRDDQNRSLIGRIRIDIRDPQRWVEVSSTPVLGLGGRGTFDQNGVSYPWLLRTPQDTLLYYVGWIPTVLTPFQNFLGAARLRSNGTFERVSRAPILDRTDADRFSIGSSCVVHENDRYRLYYTCFESWGGPGEPKHSYVIKYAESKDGLKWERQNQVCIRQIYGDEHSICHPSALQIDGMYHMWFCYRGDQYRIGYAISEDGIHWDRRDAQCGIGVSESGFDSKAVAYPHVFEHRGEYFMLYNGNDYGKEGLGLAKLIWDRA